MNYDLRNIEEVKEYLENLGTEYRFSCLHEKNPEGCHLFADYLASVKNNHKKAGKIYKSNCDDYKYGHSCYKYGKYAFVGKGCTANLAEALEYFKKGCELNRRDACLHSGVILTSDSVKESIIKKDHAQGVKYLTQACNLNDALSCFIMSGFYINGDCGVPIDMAKASEFSQKSCELGHALGCMNLSRMYKNGMGVEKNEKLEKEYKAKAAELRKHLRTQKSVEFQQHI